MGKNGLEGLTYPKGMPLALRVSVGGLEAISEVRQRKDQEKMRKPRLSLQGRDSDRPDGNRRERASLLAVSRAFTALTFAKGMPLALVLLRQGKRTTNLIEVRIFAMSLF